MKKSLNYKKITHINTQDKRGGAAKFVWRLHSKQREKGLDSKIIVGFKETNTPEVESFLMNVNLKVHKACKEKSLLDLSLNGSHKLIKHSLILESDIIHFHNIHGGYFNPFSLSALSCSKPSVWTLHDMYPITGHCAFPFECNRWEIGCGECPYPESYFPISFDSTAELLKYKKMIYDKSILNIVTPTKWMEGRVNNSVLKGHRVQTIYHGIDTDTYSAGDKKSLRDKYGIPNNKVIIGTSANGGAFGDPRKGGYYVHKCLEALDNKGIDYAFVNIGAETLKESNPKIINVGFITEEKVMAELYSTLDIFLFPSLSESFGLVVVEALSCGVPVIAFEGGAISEIVANDSNGLLVDYKNEEKLIEATLELATNESLRQRYKNNARISVCNKFSFDRMLDEYLLLYENCIKEFPIHDKRSKYFDFNELPEVIKSDLFFELESKKTELLSTGAIKQKPLKFFVLINSGLINPSESLTYNSILNQTYKNVVIKFGDISDLKADDIDGDLVYYIDEGYLLEPNFFEEIIKEYINEDVLCCMIKLYRDNGTELYEGVLPKVFEKDNIYWLNLNKHNNIVFKSNYFKHNLAEIKKLKYITIDSFDQLNLMQITGKFTKYLIELIEPIGNKRLYIYGAGSHTVDLLKHLNLDKMNICGIIDRNPDLEGTLIKGIKVYNSRKIKDLNIEYIIISSASYESEIFQALRDQFEEDRLITIYGGI